MLTATLTSRHAWVHPSHMETNFKGSGASFFFFLLLCHFLEHSPSFGMFPAKWFFFFFLQHYRLWQNVQSICFLSFFFFFSGGWASLLANWTASQCINGMVNLYPLIQKRKHCLMQCKIINIQFHLLCCAFFVRLGFSWPVSFGHKFHEWA